MVKRKRKTFPSEVRYRERNPMVSFRLKREYYDQLKEVVERSDKPIAQFIREIALGVNKEESTSYTRGYEDGDKKANEECVEYFMNGEGFDQTYGSGYEEGQVCGLSQGRKNGYENGRKKGFEDGIWRNAISGITAVYVGRG